MRPVLALTAFSALLLSVGCSSPSAKGTLTDGITGQPIQDMRLIAKATGETSLSCSAFEATTNAEGRYSFDALCSGTGYRLQPENENYWLADTDTVPDGGSESLDLKAYLAPSGEGMYRLKDGELQSIRSTADIKTEPIWNSDTEKAIYPGVLPKEPVAIGPTDHLVLVGKDTVAKTDFFPLIESGERKFGSSKTTIISMKPWSYIGMEFKSDTEFERKQTEVPEDKVVKKEKDDRIAAFIKGDAIPAGRYSVHREGATRTTVLDFGKAAQ